MRVLWCEAHKMLITGSDMLQVDCHHNRPFGWYICVCTINPCKEKTKGRFWGTTDSFQTGITSFSNLLAYEAVSLRVVLADCVSLFFFLSPFLSFSSFSAYSWVQLDKANTRSERNALRNTPRPLLRPCKARISSDESNSSLRTKLFSSF